jgi:hypothetical protein
MAYQDFVDGLRALGYEVEERGANRITFLYPVPVGKFAGQTITVGYEVPGDFPANPPSGPHIKPRLHPISGGNGSHPLGGIHEREAFGPEFQYWSRPMHHWATTKRTVKDVIAFLHKLFDTQ